MDGWHNCTDISEPLVCMILALKHEKDGKNLLSEEWYEGNCVYTEHRR